MSFIISNQATIKQKTMLVELDYIGTGNYHIDQLSKQEASNLINELLEEKRLEERDKICHL